MSYSPSEAVRDAQNNVEFLKLLAEQHPRAWRVENPLGLWVDGELTLEDCDTAILTQITFMDKPRDVIWLGKKVGEGAVFTHPSDVVNLWTASSELLLKISAMVRR